MEENDVDRYIRESSKSYKNCKVKNSARRNSLQKRTLGIEQERRLAQSELSREEKQLRKHLKQMQIDKMKHNILHTLREKEFKKTHSEESDDTSGSEAEHPAVVTSDRLYPLLYSPASSPRTERTKKMSLEEKGTGRQYASRGHRRLSREFEDLDMDTKTGSLLKPYNVAKRILSGRNRSFTLSFGVSPKTGRRSAEPSSARCHKHVEFSDESSPSPMSSLEDLHWIGDPEATKSVRRGKKTMEDQMISSELHRLKKN